MLAIKAGASHHAHRATYRMLIEQKYAAHVPDVGWVLLPKGEAYLTHTPTRGIRTRRRTTALGSPLSAPLSKEIQELQQLAKEAQDLFGAVTTRLNKLQSSLPPAPDATNVETHTFSV